MIENVSKLESLKTYKETAEKEKEKSLLLKKERQTKAVTSVSPSKVFYPSEKDSLFWCFYVIKYGLMNYQMLQYKNIVFEKKIKIEYVEKMRKSKQLLKINKDRTPLIYNLD